MALSMLHYILILYHFFVEMSNLFQASQCPKIDNNHTAFLSDNNKNPFFFKNSLDKSPI